MKSFLGLLLAGILASTTQIAVADEPATSKHSASAPRIERSEDSRVSSPDATLRREREIKSSIEAWHTRVQGKVKAIESLAVDLDLKKIQNQHMVTGELKDLLSDLDDEASAIIEAYEALGPDLALYRRALEAAPASFLRIADELKESALQTRSEVLQQTYADFAAQARQLANHYGEQAKGIQTLELDVEGKIAFVRESREFFTEVRKLLDAIPADSGFATERLVDRMNKYIEVFQNAMNAMRGVGEKITAKKAQTSSPSDPRATDPSGKAATAVDPFARIGLGLKK